MSRRGRYRSLNKTTAPRLPIVETVYDDDSDQGADAEAPPLPPHAVVEMFPTQPKGPVAYRRRVEPTQGTTTPNSLPWWDTVMSACAVDTWTPRALVAGLLALGLVWAWVSWRG